MAAIHEVGQTNMFELIQLLPENWTGTLEKLSVSNAKYVLTLETLGQLHTFSFRNAETMGKGTGNIYKIHREHFTVYDDSRVFYEDLVKFRRLLLSSQLLDDIYQYR